VTALVSGQSPFISKSEIPDPHNVNLWLKVNGVFKQHGNTKDMMFKIPQLIEHVSSIMTLEEGDLLLTGTPSGVGPIYGGDKITAGLALPQAPSNPVTTLEFDVIDRAGGYQFSPTGK